MKRKIKVFLIVILVIYQIFCINHVVFAVSGSDLAGLFDGKNGVGTADGERLMTDVMSTVLSVIRIVAIGIAIIMITVLGIKYMSAAPSEKANIKNQLITFTVGAVVVVGTTSILGMIKDTVAAVTAVR